MKTFSWEYTTNNGQKDFWLEVFKQAAYVKPTICAQVEVNVILSGQLRLYTQGKIFDFSGDDVFSLNPGQSYSLQVLSEPCYVMRLSVNKNIRFGGQIDYYFGNTLRCASTENNRDAMEYRMIRYYLALICEALLKAEKVDLFEANGLMILLQAHLIKYFTAIQNMPRIEPNILDPEVQSIMDYTEEHYLAPLTLNDVSAMAGKNRSYFSSYFKKQTGFGWYSYLIHLRLRQAVTLLNDTEDTLLHIAFSSGFCDSKSFFTAFKRFFRYFPQRVPSGQ